MKANLIISASLAFVVFTLVGLYKCNNPTQVVVKNTTASTPADEIYVASDEDKAKIEALIEMTAEKAYLEGQRDAINGIVVIFYDLDDSVYAWKDSPWTSRKPAKYKPTRADNELLHYTK